VAVFAAVAIGLNFIRIPAFMWPGLFYPIWEIPAIIACLLFGFRIAIMVGLINLLGQLVFFQLGPGSLVGYPMGFVALLVTLLGVYAAKTFIMQRTSRNSIDNKSTGVLLTGFTTAFRVCIMPFIDYLVFYGILLPLVGIPIPDAYRAALIPYFILFNLMVPLYTLPIAYLVSKKVAAYTKINPSFNR
jgi:riboflavin transporter FmnP